MMAKLNIQYIVVYIELIIDDMKLIITCIAICLLYPAVFAQDTIPEVQPPAQTETIEPAVAPVAEPAAAVAAAPSPAKTQAEQPAKKSDWKKKIYYGGYFNFTLGSYTSIGIEPMIGYKLIPRLSVGLKIRYDYVQDKRFSETYTYSNYGGSVFTRLSIFKGLYAHAEYAGYNYESYNQVDGGSSRIWVPYFLVGAGFSQPMGKRASLNAQVLFDVLNNANSPYNSWEPFYSVGVGVGF